MKDIVAKELLLPQDIDTVWRAITEQESLNEWFMPAKFRAEVGFKYTFNSPDENCSAISGEVLEATPYTLRYTWIEQGMEAITEVKWNLTTTEKGTHLQLVHSGFSNYDGATAVKMFEGFNNGWEKFMTILQDYASKMVNA